MQNDLIVASFSGGLSSARMTKILMDNIPTENLIIVFANTGKEHEKTLDFVHDFEINFGVDIVWLEYDSINAFKIVNYNTASRDGTPFLELINKRNYLPNVVTRFCTTELKIRPIKKYILSLGYREWVNAIGIRYDEPLRIAKMNKRKERYTTIAPLNDFKITKSDVNDFWKNQKFTLEIENYLGNCDCCFLKGINKIKQIEKDTPHLLDWWIEQELRLKKTFRKSRPLLGLRKLIKSQPTLFDGLIENDIECQCNID